MDPDKALTAWKQAGRGKTGRALAGTSPERYEDDVTDWLEHCLSHRLDPFAITTSDIINWATTRPGDGPRGLSVSTHARERRLSALAGFYAWSQEMRLVHTAPDLRAHRAHNYDAVRGLYKPSPAEREALSEAAAEWKGGQRAPQPERDQLVIRCLLWGLRPRQIISADLKDLHHHGTGHMTIDLLYPSGDGTDRHQPVPPTVARALTRYLPVRRGTPDGPLITSRTGRRLEIFKTLGTILRNVAATHPTLQPVIHQLTPDGIAASSPDRPRRTR